ncbi:threonine/serine exporter family protein [Mycolicibacterium palauense]|uniref:threonine/serine ThrE exporter family protein n=1 Tax=Mycolicibacterium palauense TaxID=2034511 RepID=UPI000BFED6BA|nr:threonine/serine exporter family protein [Mycolicibacterium palauense]
MPTGWRGRAEHAWGSLKKVHPDPLGRPGDYDEAEVAAMLRELGIAMVEMQTPTQMVRARLQQIAAQYTTREVRVVAFPTTLIIQLGSHAHEVAVSTHGTAQLNVAERVDRIAVLATVGAITPADALAEVVAARAVTPRFGPVLTLFGYVLTTLGFGVMINPTWADLPGYVGLGAVVGLIVVFVGRIHSLAAVIPPLSAAVVTILATWFFAGVADEGLLLIIAPALVALLPGISLTVASMELASGATMAGATRLVYAVVQLMLLVFGVAIGAAIAGRGSPHHPSAQMGGWSFYVAILVVSVGLYFYLSAPRGSLPWLAAAVAVALLGQKLGGTFLSPGHSGALGAFLTVPFTLLATRLRGAPPPFVLLIAAFWSLVPGALSFETLTEAAAAGSSDLAELEVTVAAVFSIALGTLIGWSVFTPLRRIVQHR